MYLEHFGLLRLPFTIAPDPDLLFPSKNHQEALAHLHYALTGHGGLVCLTGEVGTGKTTLCRAFLADLPKGVRSAYIFNPQLSPVELLQAIAEEFGIATNNSQSQRELYNLLNQTLLEGYAKGERFICVIDEAQTMPASLLEQVRLLTNLETNHEKLLTLILVGQPELQQVLANHNLRQLNQRITARFHLSHLSWQDCVQYINYRCEKSGAKRNLFSTAAMWRLWRASKGIPRILNTLADRALLGAYALNKHRVGWTLVRGAQAEVLPKYHPQTNLFWPVSLVALLLTFSVFFLKDLKELSLPWLSSTEDLPVLALSQQLQLGEYKDCTHLQEGNWSCMWLDWPLSQLKQLNTPVMVQVNTGEKLQWQLLSSLGANVAYTKQALLLWQGPSAYHGQLVRPNEVSHIVPWVRQQLNFNDRQGWQRIGSNSQSVGPDPNFYDALLAFEVERFQRQHNLTPDRILGQQTLLMLWLKERG